MIRLIYDYKILSRPLFKINSQLKLCGEKVSDEDMLEKTYTTFHVSNPPAAI